MLALVVASVLVTVPTVLLAAIRLHRRNLAGLIAASGWALNDRMRLTGMLGRLFTRHPPLPAEVVAQTRDFALDQLKQVDPAEVVRERADMSVRVATVLTMTVLLLCLVVPAGQSGLSTAIWIAAAVHLVMLAYVAVQYVLTRRFPPVFWWPIMTAIPAGILVLVNFLLARVYV